MNLLVNVNAKLVTWTRTGHLPVVWCLDQPLGGVPYLDMTTQRSMPSSRPFFVDGDLRWFEGAHVGYKFVDFVGKTYGWSGCWYGNFVFFLVQALTLALQSSHPPAVAEWLLLILRFQWLKARWAVCRKIHTRNIGKSQEKHIQHVSCFDFKTNQHGGPSQNVYKITSLSLRVVTPLHRRMLVVTKRGPQVFASH